MENYSQSIIAGIVDSFRRNKTGRVNHFQGGGVNKRIKPVADFINNDGDCE